MSLTSFIVSKISKNSDLLSKLEGQLDSFNYSEQDVQDIKEGRKEGPSTTEQQKIKKVSSRVDKGITYSDRSNNTIKSTLSTLNTVNNALDTIIKALKLNPTPNISTTVGLTLTFSDLLKSLSNKIDTNKGIISSIENSLNAIEQQKVKISEKNNRLKQIT